MSKITEYTSVNTFDSGDVLLKDGTNGTKIIPVESAASEFLRLGGQTAKNAEIETALTNFGSNLAGLEAEYVATNDYAVGDFFMVENKLYKATAAIADGATIVPDTNCVETDISTEFKATKDIVDGLSEEIVKKANVDGYYTNLSAGTADQLMASQKVHNTDPYIFRTSGGASDIGNREELEIVGGSIVWNQLFKNGDYSSETGIGTVKGGTSAVVDGVLEYTLTDVSKNNTYENIVYKDVEIPAGHVVFVLQRVLLAHTVNKFFIWFTGPGTAQNFVLRDSFGNEQITGNNWVTLGRVCRRSDDAGKKTTVQLFGRNPIAAGYSVGDVDKIDNVMIIDLTTMFGSEIADHILSVEETNYGAGVAWFRKYFPNDYYDYNAGELMHVSDLQSHDTVGFNAFNSDAGTAELIGGNQYQITGTYTALTIDGEAVTLDSDGCFTPEKDCTLTVTGGNNTTTCVHLVLSGTRDGEYEPYVKHSYPLDSSLTLRGVPKLTADGDLTYNGDIYKPDGTVERRAVVVTCDGSESWNTDTNGESKYFFRKIGAVGSVVPSVGFCDKYNRVYIYQNNTAVGFTLTNSTARNGAYIYLRPESTADTTVDQLKASLAENPITIIYLLAEPTIEEAEPYTSPQIVDDWGTEEFVTTSIVPVGHNTSYPANLRDKLQHLPDLPDDDGYYMIQVDGTQMSLIRFRIPQAPAEDGTYVLKATVTDGVPVYTWVDPDAVPETEKPTEP